MHNRPSSPSRGWDRATDGETRSRKVSPRTTSRRRRDVKRGDVVFANNFGICLVMGPASGQSGSVCIVAYMAKVPTSTRADTPGQAVMFGLLNESDAIPLNLPPELREFQALLEATQPGGMR